MPCGCKPSAGRIRSEGIALCRFDNAKMVKTEVENSTREEGTARPRQVRLTDCGAVISGSDHGAIYIYDRKTGERLDERVDH